MGHPELCAQALRINSRYLREVVEAFDLCPWASSVSDGAGLSRSVQFSATDTPELRAELHSLIEAMAADTSIDIGLLIFPSLRISNSDFRSLVAAMETMHGQAHERDQVPLAMANFHPQAVLDLSSPARLVSFIRRAPDPTIQLVRRSAMARVKGPDEGSVFAESLASFMPLLGARPKTSVSDNIARNNLRTIERVGAPAIEKILDDIARDREAAYLWAMDPGGGTPGTAARP